MENTITGIAAFYDRLADSILTPEQMHPVIFEETNPLLIDWLETVPGQNTWMRLDDLYWLPPMNSKDKIHLVFPANMKLSPVERPGYQVKFTRVRTASYGLVPSRKMFVQRMENPDAQFPFGGERARKLSRMTTPDNHLGASIKVFFADEI